jgi:hypothetical protein
MSHSTPSKTGAAYLNWRVQLLWKKVEFKKCKRASVKEAYENGKLTREQYEVHRAKMFDTQDSLEDEERTLYG